MCERVSVAHPHPHPPSTHCIQTASGGQVGIAAVRSCVILLLLLLLPLPLPLPPLLLLSSFFFFFVLEHIPLFNHY